MTNSLERTVIQSRIRSFSREIRVGPGRERGYVQAIARRIFGTDQIGSLSVKQLGMIEGVLLDRVRQLNRPDRVVEIENQARADAERIAEILRPSMAA